jgi:protein-tyrosine-phosphatase
MATPRFKLLYVCNGNSARSPLAAACTSQILRAKPDGVIWDIGSAGTHTLPDEVMHPDAVKAASQIDIDISDHPPSPLSVDQCGDPDLILAMSWDQVSHIWSFVPEAWDRVFTIKEFVHWAQRAPVRPPILFSDRLEAMRDTIIQAHSIRKRARADYGFWGGIRPQDLNLIEPNGKGEEAWTALANAVHALVSDVIMLLRGPEHQEARPKAVKAVKAVKASKTVKTAKTAAKTHKAGARRSPARAKARR